MNSKLFLGFFRRVRDMLVLLEHRRGLLRVLTKSLKNEKLTNLLRQAELGIYDSVYVIEDELHIE
jgi:hypothetical protein